MIRRAKKSEHKKILKLTRQHKSLSAFGHSMFSGPAAYKKGWIRVLESDSSKKKSLLGFTCVRHKVRQPETSLYFIGVSEGARRQGAGRALIEDIKAQSPHRRIALNVTKDNGAAIAFYEKLGFRCEAESLEGKGWKMVLGW